MKKFISLFVLITLSTLTHSIFGVTANPESVTIKQPNGVEITVYPRGDERIHWLESIDGYSLMYNNDGYIVYAMLNEKGDMVPSEVIAQNAEKRTTSEQTFLQNTKKKLFYSDTQVDLLLQIWKIADDETRKTPNYRGQINTICVLMGTPDVPFTKTLEDFELLLNQEGYNGPASGVGSVRDFYLENTYGIIDMQITAAGPYMASKNMSNYVIPHTGNLVREAAKLVSEDGIDLSIFDNDNDGIIDVFHVVFAGHGAENGLDEADHIWSHKSQLQPPMQIDGKSLSVYSCSPEMRGATGNNITTIGVIAHEMGHVFGSPDYYDTDYEGSGGSYVGTGKWDLMADGSWNGSPGGSCPAHTNMHQKYCMGWVDAIRIVDEMHIEDMPHSGAEPVAYIIETSTSYEYYLLENRQKIGFDASIPGHGLLIYHVHSKATQRNVDNRAHPQQVYPVCASSKHQMPSTQPFTYGMINTFGCPFPGTSKKTEFTDDTTPTMWSWEEMPTDLPIRNITENTEKNTISFCVLCDSEKINETQANHIDVNVFPNPAQTEIFIDTKNIQGSTTATIFDIAGKQVLQQKWDGEQIQNISIQNLSKGIYFIKVATEKGENTQKLIVN